MRFWLRKLKPQAARMLRRHKRRTLTKPRIKRWQVLARALGHCFESHTRLFQCALQWCLQNQIDSLISAALHRALPACTAPDIWACRRKCVGVSCVSTCCLDTQHAPPHYPADAVSVPPLSRTWLTVWTYNSLACRHPLTLSFGRALTCHILTRPSQCANIMDPLRDPLHDSVLEEALDDTGLEGTAVHVAAVAPEEPPNASIAATADASDAESQAGSMFSTLTAALEADDAAEPVPADPHAPAGPPVPTPLWMPHDDLGSMPAPFSILPSMPSSTSPPPAHTIGPMPGEHSVDGPAWHRSLVQNVLQHLGCSAPAFLSAPETLAEVHSWNALRVSISEAGPTDYLTDLPIEIQDADSTLFRADAVGATGDECEDAAGEEHTESEAREHDSPFSPSDHDDDGPGGADGDSGTDWNGRPVAGSSSRPRPHSSSRSRSPPGALDGLGNTAAAAMAELDPEDPLHMIHQDASRDYDWVYEVDGVSFNLSAAQRCLETTRRTVATLRAGNRHRRSETPGPSSGAPASGDHRASSPTLSPMRLNPSPDEASRSRSRRRRRSSSADRWGGCQIKQECKLAGNESQWSNRCLPSQTCPGEPVPCPPIELLLIGRLEMCECSKHQPPWRSSELTLPDRSADRSLARVGLTTLPHICVEKVRLRPQLALLHTFCWCAGCATLALGLLLSMLEPTHQHLRLTHRYQSPAYLASWVAVAREAWSECLWNYLWSIPYRRLSQAVPPCLQVLDLILRVAFPNLASCSSSLHPGPTKVSACPLATTQSRPGPKSRGLSNRCMQYLILLLCLQPACAGSQAEARVAVHATRTAGGICSVASCLPASMPKPGGFPTSVKTRQPLNVPNKRSAKRAFQRACNRATRYGHTQYRGRTFTSAQVPSDRRQAVPLPCFTRARKHTSPEGLTVLSWNAGGLGGGVYDEIMTHLSASNVDIAVIQESKWSECMEYTSGAWSCIHSGCKTRKHAGILVAVHSRVALPSQLRFEHYLKGRLLHVRVPLQTSDSRHLHVIAIYQKTHVVSDKNTPVQRQQAWQALHKCLSRVPARDSIVLTGDFNTPLACMPPFVGPFVGTPLSHPPDDVSTLEVLMQTFRLTALNTWYPNPGGVHTFSFGKARSQIDYIMVRLSEASTLARQVKTLHQFQVGAARRGGAYHSPLQTNLAVSKPYWVNTGHRTKPCIDQEALLSALDHPNKAHNLQKIAQIRQVVATHVAHHSDLQGVQSLHQVLHDACCTVFPANKTLITSAPPWQQPQVQAGVRNLWSKWRAFKQVRKHGLRGWFQAWRAWKDFDRNYRAHQQRCKQARRAVLLDAMYEAEQHAQTHNTRGIYQILKRLAPKQARRRMQLRGTDGQMLEPCAELDLLEQHFSRRFTATQQADVDLASHTWEGKGALVLDVATVLPVHTAGSSSKSCAARAPSKCLLALVRRPDLTLALPSRS